MIETKIPFNVIQLSKQALEEVNSLLKEKVEIIIAIDNNGGINILEGDSRRVFLVTDECSQQNFTLESIKDSCDTDGQFAVSKFVPQEASDSVVRELTDNKIVKKVVPIGLTLYKNSGCLCGVNGCISWL